jgi:hypothetical protein
MARYVGFIAVAIDDFQNLQPVVLGILEECNLEVSYNTGNYIMARERRGEVSFSQLAIAEVTFNLASITGNTIRIDLIVKNEALPSQKDNHCRQVFDLFIYWAMETEYWQVIESMIPEE